MSKKDGIISKLASFVDFPWSKTASAEKDPEKHIDQMPIYFLGGKALGDKHLYFQPLDGYLGYVEIEDPNFDTGLASRKGPRVMRYGQRVKTEFLPTRIRPTTNQLRMPDFAVAHLAQINYRERLGHVCLARFRDVVESLEPGVHQFVPVEAVRKNGAHLADMFWFIPCNRLDTLVVNPADPYRYRYGGLDHHADAVFSRSRIGDHHIWIEKQDISGQVWVSEAFRDAAVSVGLTGFELIPRRTV